MSADGHPAGLSPQFTALFNMSSCLQAANGQSVEHSLQEARMWGKTNKIEYKKTPFIFIGPVYEFIGSFIGESLTCDP